MTSDSTGTDPSHAFRNLSEVARVLVYSEPVCDQSYSITQCNTLYVVLPGKATSESVQRCTRMLNEMSYSFAPGFDVLRFRCNALLRNDHKKYVFLNIWDDQILRHLSAASNHSIQLHLAYSQNLGFPGFLRPQPTVHDVIMSAEQGLLTHQQILTECVLNGVHADANAILSTVYFCLVSGLTNALVLWQTYPTTYSQVINEAAKKLPTLREHILSLNLFSTLPIDAAYERGLALLRALIKELSQQFPQQTCQTCSSD